MGMRPELKSLPFFFPGEGHQNAVGLVSRREAGLCSWQFARRQPMLSCPGCRHGHCAHSTLPRHGSTQAHPPAPTPAPSPGVRAPFPPIWAASPCARSCWPASCSWCPRPRPAALHPLATQAAPIHCLLCHAKVGCEGRVSLGPRNLQSKQRELPYRHENKGCSSGPASGSSGGRPLRGRCSGGAGERSRAAPRGLRLPVAAAGSGRPGRWDGSSVGQAKGRPAVR